MSRYSPINWIVWYAIIQHAVWAFTLLVSDAPMGITAIDALRVFTDNRIVMASMYFAASLLSLRALLRDKLDSNNVLLLIPQQFFLMLSAYGAVKSMWIGAFADGVIRPHEFLIADQLPAVLIGVMHTLAITTPFMSIYKKWI